MSRTTAGRVLAILVAALTLVPVGLAAPAAQAVNPVLNPVNRLGDVTVGTSSGAISSTGRPQALTTPAGCPEGFRGSSRVLFIWPDGTWPVANPNLAADSGYPAQAKTSTTPLVGTGLDGSRINRTGLAASRWSTANFPPDRFDGRSGVATYVVTCDPGDVPGTTAPLAGDGVGSSKYFSVDLRLTWDDAGNTGTWEVVPEVPVEKTDTTTTLTPTAGNDGSVTLTAAVTPAAVAPAAATGDVTFTNVGTGATVGTDALENGVASVTVGDLEADTQYTFRAQYAGDALHDPSTSNNAIVTTVAEPLPPQDTEITVTIPATASGLQFTITPDGVALSDAQLTGEEYVATGTLQEVRVTDNRQSRQQWTLNGQVSDFTGPGDATIDGSALGWEPALVGSENAGSAGPNVAPGANGGLSSSKPLAQAPAGVTLSGTRVSAGITLRAPATTPGGDYAATLTLTLI